MARILIAGCGYVGSALGVRLAALGHEVWGLRRTATGLPAGVHHVAADLKDPHTLRQLPPAIDTVFYTAAADGMDDAAYRAIYVDGLRYLLEALVSQRQSPRRVFFTSSTAVYAQAHGEWVDEASPTEPEHFTGRRVLEGERLLLTGPFPATVLRLGGIYGPGRVGLIERVRQGLARCREGSALYINRIHRDDCAGALHHLMTLPQPDAVYIGVDHEPAEQCDVLRWLAAQLGAPPPRVEALPGVEPRRSRTNKRCCNAKLIASGYTFRYPTFRDGYAALLAARGT
ncbi:MAG TPA: SDR family oxidoreductase [Alphaproteobacteria bacterium]|nr:SDR family oxidoreductase [Alphaproteobacteria bacterium]